MEWVLSVFLILKDGSSYGHMEPTANDVECHNRGHEWMIHQEAIRGNFIGGYGCAPREKWITQYYKEKQMKK